MVDSSSQISTFMASLTHHPQAADLIPLVEQLLNVDDPTSEKLLISSLQQICANNSAFLTALWTLRGTILLEEGDYSKAVSFFWEALNFDRTLRAPWQQVIDLFLHRQEPIKASFFLMEAQFLFPSDSDFQVLFHQLSQRLVSSLHHRPGIILESANNSFLPSTELSSSSPDSSPRSYSPSRKGLPSSVLNTWDLAKQCFDSYLSDQSVIYCQAFIHHAHTSARELLGLDGNFHQGLDKSLRDHHLSDYKLFFSKLNRTRNAVQHDNFIPSPQEVTDIYEELLAILTLYGPLPA
jgi:tetratricopeptide (TPR) repeat protein